MKTVELVAIINSFNRLALFREALPSLVSALDKIDAGSAIVVFEAGSTDGTREWLSAFAGKAQNIPIRVLTPDKSEDTSFSAGLNSACKFATDEFPYTKWLLFFETDNLIQGPEPLMLATKLLENEEKIAATGFSVTKLSGETAGSGTSFPTAWQFIIGPQLTFRLGLDKPDLSTGGKVDRRNWSFCSIVYTSPLLVRRKAWEQSGGMDAKDFPFSECDLDWCWRLNKLGWKIAVIDIDGVIHDNREALSTWSEKRAMHFHRARLKLLCRHLGDWVNCLKPFLFMRHLLELLLLFIMVPLGKRPFTSIKIRWRLLTTAMNGYR